MNDEALLSLADFERSLPQNAFRIFRLDENADRFAVFAGAARTLCDELGLEVKEAYGASDAKCQYVEFSEDILKESLCTALPESTQLEVYTEKSLVTRGLASDKTIFDDFIFRTDATTLTLRITSPDAINEHAVHIFCAYANLSLRTIGCTSFYDQRGTFQNLKSLLFTAQARDIIVEIDDRKGTRASRAAPAKALLRTILSEDDCRRLEDIVARHHAHFIGMPATDIGWETSNATHLVKTVCSHRFVQPQWLTDFPEEVAVVSGLIAYLDLVQEECNYEQFKLKRMPIGTYAAIDENAVEALHLFNSPFSTHEKSVFAILEHHCNTKMGSRLMRFYLSQPLRDIDAILQRQEMVSMFVEDDFIREAVTRVLRKVPDVDMLLKRFQRRQATLKDVQALKGFLDAVLDLCGVLQAYSGTHAELLEGELLNPVQGLSEPFQRLASLILQVVEDADPYGHVVRIRPQFDEALQRLDDERALLLKTVEDMYREILQQNGWTEKTVKLEAISSANYALRITRKDDKIIRGTSAFKIVQTLKDCTRFVTPAMQELNASLKNVSQEYAMRQEALEAKLLEIVWTYRPVLDDGNDCVSKLDVFCALGTMVVRSRQTFCRPTFDTTAIRLEGARHFILGETMDAVGNGIEFVHADGCGEDALGNPFDTPSGEVFIVTGPNMGGKSTLMRAVAITIILAQMGSYVPCTSAQLCVRDAVLTRVGANDSILHGDSTFMIEMRETNHILSNATRDSFVIIDELGRGTSTYDGFGIAYAVAEELATKTHCFTMLSTHYHEMTFLDANLNSRGALVQNVHMSATCTELEIHFPYKLLPGPALKSFGLHVARVTRFPDVVLQYAEDKVDALELAMKQQPMKRVSFADEAESAQAEAIPSTLVASYLQALVITEDANGVKRAMERDAAKYPILTDFMHRLNASMKSE